MNGHTGVQAKGISVTVRFTWNGIALEQADLPGLSPAPVTAGVPHCSISDSDTRNGTPLLSWLYRRRAFLAIFRSISLSRSTPFISASANR